MAAPSSLWRTSLASLTLRALTLGGKFILVLFIARFLSVEDLGIFGLFNVTIALAVLPLGMDFHQFAMRELLAKPDERGRMIRDQAVFHLTTYIIFLPLFGFLFVADLLPGQYVLWFYLLLILEHVSQEGARLLVTLSKPVAASTVIFMRSGFWALIAIGLAWAFPQWRSLPFIWLVWAIGQALSLGLVGRIAQPVVTVSLPLGPVNWPWIAHGVRIAMPFFLSTLAFTAMQYLDRYFLMAHYGERAVGIYTLYANIANVVQIFVFAGISMILFPQMVAAWQQGHTSLYRALYRKLTVGIIGGSLGLAVVMALAIEPILWFVDRPAYAEHADIFWILLGSTVLLAISHLPHYALYVRGADSAIWTSTLLALIVAVLGNTILVPQFGLMGAALATATAMLVLTIAKTVRIQRLRSRNKS